MDKKLILTDIDGVMLIWREAFDRYMEGIGVKPVMDKQISFDLARFYGMEQKAVYKEVEKFNSGHWEFGTLRPYPDAVESVKYIHDRMGYKFVAITSCSTLPQAVALRKANLFNIFGDIFEAVHCVDVGEPKNTHLADYEPTFWIEDKPQNCLAGIQYGHDCILMTRDHNEDEHNDGWTRVNNWQEIINHIQNCSPF